ncbi:MAG: hypothetical protein ACYDA8_16800 [Deferrisomatales bacterium]
MAETGAQRAESAPEVSEPVLEPGAAEPEFLPPDEGLAPARAEESAVDEAASRPAAGAPGGRPRPEREGGFLLAVAALAALFLFAWVGGTAVWQLRRDLATLDQKLQGLEERSRRLEVDQARGVLLRVGADLQTLGAALPPGLGAEVARAQALLEEVRGQLDAAR